VAIRIGSPIPTETCPDSEEGRAGLSDEVAGRLRGLIDEAVKDVGVAAGSG
jgi:hypothetical protein